MEDVWISRKKKKEKKRNHSVSLTREGQRNDSNWDLRRPLSLREKNSALVELKKKKKFH